MNLIRAYCGTLLFFLLAGNQLFAQNASIQAMSWDKNMRIHIKMQNDSIHILSVDNLHHAKSQLNATNPVYYPVSLSEEFIKKLEGQKFLHESDSSINDDSDEYSTLWNAVHSRLGGGWEHFVNCFLFALESNTIRIDHQLMKRPDSKWKPSPMTETYRRTKKWEYYVPVNQKYAIKEYKRKVKENSLGNLNLLPKEFIALFLNTNNSKYNKMIRAGNRREKAKVDLVKILLGANYLGRSQILYLSNGVFTSSFKYSSLLLPSVIIIEEFNAAVAMSLSVQGYKIEGIVFQNEEWLSSSEKEEKTKSIKALIQQINHTNKQIFEEKLKTYYKKKN